MTDDPTTTSDDADRAGEELGRAMTAMVSGIDATPQLRARVIDGLAALPRRRSSRLPRRTLAAAAAVMVLLGAAVVLTGGDGEDATRDLVTADDSPSPPPAPPTTVDLEGWTSATVLGAVITRPPEADDPPPVDPAPTTQPAPPTTQLVCRDSVDPACGDFHWDPVPVVPQATIQIIPPPEAPRAGVPFELTLVATDPGTMPDFDCGWVWYEPFTSGVQIGQPCSMVPLVCPERYGPWTPPPHQGGTVEQQYGLTLEEPGTYTIWASIVPPNDRCPNVDPYGSSATATITIEVRE